MTEPLPPEPEAGAAAPHSAVPHFRQCPKHGRVFDASKDAGCSQCLAEGTTADAPSPAGPAAAGGARQGLSRGALIGLLLVLAAVFVVPRLMKNGDAGAGPQGGGEAIAAAASLGAGGDNAISRGRPRSNRFDPAVYESPLRALETALYEVPASDAYAAVGRTDGAARLLMAQVLARNTTSGAAQEFMRALQTTITRLSESAEGGYVLPDFYSARGNWERIRTEYFQDAEWYHAPMPLEEVGVGAGGARQGAREETPAFYRVSAYANDLERIMSAYRATLLGFPSRGERQLTADEAAQYASDYVNFARQWDDELDQAERLGPRSWGAGDASFRALSGATQQLSRALTALRTAAPERGVPTRQVRTGALRTAETAIARARQLLAAVSADSI